MDRVTFTITDMHCPNCVMRLEGIEDDLPGVHRATASYRSQTMEVEYDEALVTVKEIASAIRDKGYEPIC
ncbi:MAG: heavy-metal-associated domain-containing protein [Anaerolineaceae bacterium]|nr:heavy-metal-associated domain-containing protein [Anaerolineaceae bacterium]